MANSWFPQNCGWYIYAMVDQHGTDPSDLLFFGFSVTRLISESQEHVAPGLRSYGVSRPGN